MSDTTGCWSGRILVLGLLYGMILGTGAVVLPVHSASHVLPPVSADIREGTEAFQEALRYARPGDPAMQSRLNGIMHRIAAVSDLPTLPFELRLLADKIPNAGCLPGGKMVVFEGLWDADVGWINMKHDDEIAAVIAHEIAHATSRHWARSELGHERARDQDYEIEADARGMIFMARAGYHPKSMIKIHARHVMRARHGDGGNTLRHSSNMEREWSRAFASHPSNEQRLKALRKNLAEAMQIYRAGQ